MTQGEGQGRLASEHRFEEKKEKTALIIYRGHFTQITSDFCPPLDLDRSWSGTKKGYVVCCNAM